MFGNLRSATLSVKQSLCNSLGLPFPKLLEMRELDELVKGAKVTYYNRIYTPLVTLFAFIAQPGRVGTAHLKRTGLMRMVGHAHPTQCGEAR
jgi:hypothetical protein